MSEFDDLDLTEITPDEFVQMVRSVDDDQVVEAIHVVGTDAALARMFDGFEERFQPDRAKNTTAKVQFVILDGDDEHMYTVHIHDGTCDTGPGSFDEPRVSLRLKLLDFVKLITGQAKGPMLFMGGKLKIQGDLMFASRLMNFFEVPTG